ncbi:MAG TPA: hypothetical protein VER11_25485 [Polyangiaceae bacterium]|nr:hypothetical protein [Polyangiaceae bacterium]
MQQAAIVHTNCQKCGELRPVKHVQFQQNIGLLIVRFPKTLSGALCKPCISGVFWEYTLITLFLGWWGVISFFSTLIAIPTNIVQFIQSRSLPS